MLGARCLTVQKVNAGLGAAAVHAQRDGGALGEPGVAAPMSRAQLANARHPLRPLRSAQQQPFEPVAEAPWPGVEVVPSPPGAQPALPPSKGRVEPLPWQLFGVSRLPPIP